MVQQEKNYKTGFRPYLPQVCPSVRHGLMLGRVSLGELFFTIERRPIDPDGEMLRITWYITTPTFSHRDARRCEVYSLLGSREHKPRRNKDSPTTTRTLESPYANNRRKNHLRMDPEHKGGGFRCESVVSPHPLSLYFELGKRTY